MDLGFRISIINVLHITKIDVNVLIDMRNTTWEWRHFVIMDGEIVSECIRAVTEITS